MRSIGHLETENRSVEMTMNDDLPDDLSDEEEDDDATVLPHAAPDPVEEDIEFAPVQIELERIDEAPESAEPDDEPTFDMEEAWREVETQEFSKINARSDDSDLTDHDAEPAAVEEEHETRTVPALVRSPRPQRTRKPPDYYGFPNTAMYSLCSMAEPSTQVLAREAVPVPIAPVAQPASNASTLAPFPPARLAPVRIKGSGYYDDVWRVDEDVYYMLTDTVDFHGSPHDYAEQPAARQSGSATAIASASPRRTQLTPATDLSPTSAALPQPSLTITTTFSEQVLQIMAPEVDNDLFEPWPAPPTPAQLQQIGVMTPDVPTNQWIEAGRRKALEDGAQSSSWPWSWRPFQVF